MKLILKAKSSRKGLVPQKKQVSSGGKTYTTTVWVKPNKKRSNFKVGNEVAYNGKRYRIASTHKDGTVGLSQGNKVIKVKSDKLSKIPKGHAVITKERFNKLKKMGYAGRNKEDKPFFIRMGTDGTESVPAFIVDDKQSINVDNMNKLGTPEIKNREVSIMLGDGKKFNVKINKNNQLITYDPDTRTRYSLSSVMFMRNLGTVDAIAELKHAVKDRVFNGSESLKDVIADVAKLPSDRITEEDTPNNITKNMNSVISDSLGRDVHMEQVTINKNIDEATFRFKWNDKKEGRFPNTKKAKELRSILKDKFGDKIKDMVTSYAGNKNAYIVVHIKK